MCNNTYTLSVPGTTFCCHDSYNYTDCLLHMHMQCGTAVYLLMNGVSSQITLSSMPPEGRGACPMDVRTFTCVTNGSATHAWQSDEYIGASASVSGEQLEFTYLDSPGDVLAGDSPARAELIRRVLEVNETVGLLESELRVTVSADYQNATISCLYVDTGNTISTSFQLLGICML